MHFFPSQNLKYFDFSVTQMIFFCYWANLPLVYDPLRHFPLPLPEASNDVVSSYIQWEGQGPGPRVVFVHETTIQYGGRGVCQDESNLKILVMSALFNRMSRIQSTRVGWGEAICALSSVSRRKGTCGGGRCLLERGRHQDQKRWVNRWGQIHPG